MGSYGKTWDHTKPHMRPYEIDRSHKITWQWMGLYGIFFGSSRNRWDHMETVPHMVSHEATWDYSRWNHRDPAITERS
jgi:hypothetical protein